MHPDFRLQKTAILFHLDETQLTIFVEIQILVRRTTLAELHRNDRIHDVDDLFLQTIV